MTKKNIAISVKNVSKSFKLPHEKNTTIKSAFMGLAKRKPKGSYETQKALTDISFDIKEGEFFGIVGRNGSGKSTLLKMLAGIYQPTKGKIKVNGRLVPFIELGVGFNPELTGKENVYLNGALLGFSETEVSNMYDEIVEFAELERFMDQKLKNYSSGMEVRLAFSMAIRAKAEILLIDEVLAVGDADFQRKCFDYFRKLKRDGSTVVFVSHDMGAIKQFCDRAALIEKSKIIKTGNPYEISTMYNKMFLTESGQEQSSTEKKDSLSGEERWGDEWAKWESINVKLSKNKNNLEAENVIITAKGKALRHVEYPIFGFSIKNNELLQLIGTNTVRKGVKTNPLKMNEEFEIIWKVPNIFNQGLHYIDCTIAHDQASQVSDRWPEAASFKINRVEDNPYPVFKEVSFLFKERRPR